MRQTKIVLISLFGSILVWACSSGNPSTPTTTKDPVTGDKQSPDSNPSPGPAANPNAPTGGQPPAAGGAKTEEQMEACYEACDTKNTNRGKYDDLEKAQSACKCAPTACGTQCGQTAECKEDGPDEKEGDACAQCMEGAAATQCDTTFETACNADPGCKAISACYSACDPEEGDDDDDDKKTPGK